MFRGITIKPRPGMMLRRAVALRVALCACLLRAVASAEPVLAEGLDLTPFQGRLATCEAPWTAHDDACTCPPGWTAHAHACAPCAAGFFKQEPGLHACTACPESTTSFEGSVEASECLCAEGHAVGSLDSASACAPCPGSTYKSFVGNSSCVPCPPGAHTAGTGASAVDACLCPAGRALSDSGCQPCPPLHEAHRNACRPCPANTGTDAPGAPCECDAGYTPGDTEPCTACTPGKYKSGRGQRACAECPAGTHSPPASTLPEHCVCAPGFEGSRAEGSNHSGCTPCAANAFCPGHGLKLGCPEHSSSPAGAAASSDCTCLPGFFRYDNQCLECGAGFFCFAEIRTPCPANSTSQRRSTTAHDCTCVSGFAAS